MVLISSPNTHHRRRVDMDTHLTTLNATLDAISRLHSTSSRSSSRPFTAAILNIPKLDVLDFIRDADQFESNLFWYPSQSASSGSKTNVKGQQSRGRDGGLEGFDQSSAMPEINLAPRLPEPKAFDPPTPLRKAAKEAEARGLIEFDARTLLKAAQRLTENYHNVPRARKHIKALLKKHTELQRSIRDLEKSVVESDALIGKIQADPKRMTSAMKSSTSRKEEGELDMNRLQEEIRREEMEILAIEQTMEDLQEQKRKITASKSKTVKANTPRKSTEATPKKTSISSRSSVGEKTPARRASGSQNTATKSGSSTLNKKTTTVTSSPRKSTPKDKVAVPVQEAQSTVADESIRLESQSQADLADETIRLRPSERSEDVGTLPEEATEQLAMKETVSKDIEAPSSKSQSVIQSSDELERINESVWTILGENLRFAAPGVEHADVEETVEILQCLSHCKSRANGSTNATGDISTASSSVANSTAATTGSIVSSSTLSNAGCPSPTMAIAAHMLLKMLLSAAPHKLESEELKRDSIEWWKSEGLQTYSQATNKSDLDLTSLSSVDQLATKAIYEMTAKKLFKLRFEKAKRFVTFPAHI